MNKATLVLIASVSTLLMACSQPDNKAAEPAAAAPAATEAAPAPAPVEAVAAAPANEAGEKVFKGTCSMCHAAGAAGAPIKGNKDDWAPRIAQGKDLLYKHALEGFTGAKGVMPARGANTSLKDEDVKAAVDYMVSQSQ